MDANNSNHFDGDASLSSQAKGNAYDNSQGNSQNTPIDQGRQGTWPVFGKAGGFGIVPTFDYS